MLAAASIVGFLMGVHLAWMGTTLYRDLAGLKLALVIPGGAVGIGILVMSALTLAAALPAVISLLRRPTRELLATGN